MTDVIEILHYQTVDGRIPFREWLDTVTDPVAYAAIQLRQDRLAFTEGRHQDSESILERL